MEPPSTRAVTVLNESGKRLPLEPIRRAVAAALDQHGASGSPVSVLLTSDEALRELNRRFRGLDETTDVLTFPYEGAAGAPLGDIAIAVPLAGRQAQARSVSHSEEIAFLAIHGTLHLLGFDDESEDDRVVMLEQMNRAAAEAGLTQDPDWHSMPHPTPEAAR